TILTRDRRLLCDPNRPPLLFINSDHFRDQLQQVVATYHLDPFARMFSRCAHCNEPVAPVAKEHVAGHVPEYVYTTQEHFVRCGRCRRIYWPATHCDRVHAELQKMGFRPSD